MNKLRTHIYDMLELKFRMAFGPRWYNPDDTAIHLRTLENKVGFNLKLKQATVDTLDPIKGMNRAITQTMRLP